MTIQETINSSRASTGGKFLGAALLGLLGNLFFYDAVPGWGYGLYVGLLTLMAGWFHRRLWQQAWGRGLLLAMLGLTAVLIYQPNPWAIGMSLAGFLTLIMLAEKNIITDALLWTAQSAILWLIGPYRIIRDTVALWKVRGRRTRHPGAMVFGWLLIIGLALGFIALFAQANPVIAQWLEIIDWEALWRFFSVPRIVLMGFLVAITWPVLRPFTIKVQNPNPPFLSLDTVADKPRWSLLPSGMVVAALVLFNGLFLVQSGLDVTYLWGGAALPEGMTYADYAHRGAYPLIATALLAGAFVLLTLRPGSPTATMPSVRALVLLWIGQNIFLTISSVWRTWLYIEAYSLSHLRVAALIWMGLVALGLVWLLIRIFQSRSDRWLLNVNFATLALTLYLVSFVNWNQWIGLYNAQHSVQVDEKAPELDYRFMEHELFEDAIPGLLWLQQAPLRFESDRYRVVSLTQTLCARLDTQLANWRAWTWNRAQLQASCQAWEQGTISKQSTTPPGGGWQYDSPAQPANTEARPGEQTHPRRGR
jgi:hypothetical protein